MSEAEFLKHQAEHAKAAMRSALRNAGTDAVKMVDPRIWAKTHPWPTVAVAAVVGFIAANIRLWPTKATPSAQPAASKPEPAHHWLENVFQWLRRIIGLVRPLLETWLAAQATAAQNADSDGHPAAHSPAGTSDHSPYQP